MKYFSATKALIPNDADPLGEQPRKPKKWEWLICYEHGQIRPEKNKNRKQHNKVR